ncbi:hypothetical protein GGX14DRAFT_575859 [Mycena pura]|uniref:DUF6532 domain-containing protein n=1 Tax=Mycena pura TaxID=153505 RepID=A0AAD6UV52_9AGAR|nr:hypothetical protein GGX14DRAFT_575859 [Mycena pura]
MTGATLFAPCVSRLNISLKRQAYTDMDEDLNAEEHATIRVPTHDVAFVPLDNSGFQLPGFSIEWAHRSVQSRREAAMALDRVRHKWELDLMHTGRFVAGMFVRIIGKHSRKGQFGMIRDYHRVVPAPVGDGLLEQDVEWGDIRKNVRISVQMDASHLVEELTLDNVVERERVFSHYGPQQQSDLVACSSGLGVLMALLLQEFRKVNPFDRETQESGEPSAPLLQLSDLTEAETRALSGPKDPHAVCRPDIGETTGSWLTHQNLIWKRIDVRVENLQFLYNLAKQPNVGNKVGPKVTKVAGLCGYLRPFGQAVPARERGSFTLRFLARGRDANVPIVALRPLRTTPVPGELGAVSCISARQCRVIIIGPDVSGNCTRIGEYAETIPSSPPLSTEIVRVRFAWERLSDGSHHQAHAEYHIDCLCHSLNQDTPTAADDPPNSQSKKAYHDMNTTARNNAGRHAAEDIENTRPKRSNAGTGEKKDEGKKTAKVKRITLDELPINKDAPQLKKSKGYRVSTIQYCIYEEITALFPPPALKEFVEAPLRRPPPLKIVPDSDDAADETPLKRGKKRALVQIFDSDREDGESNGESLARPRKKQVQMQDNEENTPDGDVNDPSLIRGNAPNGPEEQEAVESGQQHDDDEEGQDYYGHNNDAYNYQGKSDDGIQDGRQGGNEQQKASYEENTRGSLDVDGRDGGAQAGGRNQGSRGEVQQGNNHNERIRLGPPPRKDLSSIVGANTHHPHGPERVQNTTKHPSQGRYHSLSTVRITPEPTMIIRADLKELTIPAVNLKAGTTGTIDNLLLMTDFQGAFGNKLASSFVFKKKLSLVNEGGEYFSPLLAPIHIIRLGRAPQNSESVAASGDIIMSLLDAHRARNRAKRPPTSQHLRNHQNSADADDEEMPFADDDDVYDDDEAPLIGIKRGRKTRTKRDPTSSNLNFYNADIQEGLGNARWAQRLHLAIHCLFPKRPSHFQACEEMVWVGLEKYESDTGRSLDPMFVLRYITGMAQYIWSECATWRSKKLDDAYSVILVYWDDVVRPGADQFDDGGYGQEQYYQLVASNTSQAVKNGRFARRQRDEETGVVLDFCHQALEDMLEHLFYEAGTKSVYYRCKLVRVTPEQVAAATTYLKHGFDSYETGRYARADFTANKYRDYYVACVDLATKALGKENGAAIQAVWDGWYQELIDRHHTTVDSSNSYGDVNFKLSADDSDAD